MGRKKRAWFERKYAEFLCDRVLWLIVLFSFGLCVILV